MALDSLLQEKASVFAKVSCASFYSMLYLCQGKVIRSLEQGQDGHLRPELANGHMGLYSGPSRRWTNGSPFYSFTILSLLIHYSWSNLLQIEYSTLTVVVVLLSFSLFPISNSMSLLQLALLVLIVRNYLSLIFVLLYQSN